MELILLGSGTGMPLNYGGSPSLLLMIDSEPVVIDMGPGSLRQLTKAGIDFERIGLIFITHFHPDHTADLIHFLFATRNPSVIKRRRPFVITGPTGTRKLISRLQDSYGDCLSLPSEIMTVEELDTNKKVEKDYRDFTLTACPVMHSPESIAYRIKDSSGKNFVYSGDTGFCNEIVDLAEGTDLLILECSFPEGNEVDGHLTPSEAGRIAGLSGAKKLVLTHFYPECLETDIAAQCRKIYGGELILARDFLHIHI
jgi:ribonuclease BN (tRNA processing enzyme)